MPVLIILGILISWILCWLKETADGSVAEKMTATDNWKLIEMISGKSEVEAEEICKEYQNNTLKDDLKSNEELYRKYKKSDDSYIHQMYTSYWKN